MAEPEINSAPDEAPRGTANGASEAEKPLVLIPVMAADVERRKRKIVLTWVAALLVTLAIGWVAYNRTVDPMQAKQAYDAGVRLITATHYEQAILNFDRALELQPKFPDAYRMRARAYVALYQPDSAIPDFTKVAQLDPGDATCLSERGFAYLEKKDYAHAIEDANRALSLNPKLAQAYNLRGTALRATGDVSKALEDFSRAVQIAPNLDNYFQRASTYQLLNQHKLAIADFDQAVELAPDQPHSYFARAASKAAIGDFAGAQKDIQIGRQIDGW